MANTGNSVAKRLGAMPARRLRKSTDLFDMTGLVAYGSDEFWVVGAGQEESGVGREGSIRRNAWA